MMLFSTIEAHAKIYCLREITVSPDPNAICHGMTVGSPQLELRPYEKIVGAFQRTAHDQAGRPVQQTVYLAVIENNDYLVILNNKIEKLEAKVNQMESERALFVEASEKLGHPYDAHAAAKLLR